jgi:hypothetical protein
MLSSLRSLATALALCAAAPGAKPVQEVAVPDLAQLERKIARFAPVEVTVDLGGLSPGDRKAVAKLVEASRVVDEIFLDQVYSAGPSTLEALKADPSPLGQARSKLFWINKSPWSELDQQTAFVPGVPARKPLGANFYPEDMAKEEFETYVQALPAAEQQKARGFFSVVRRGPKRELRILPYSAAYGSALARAAQLLEEAAAATPNASLKRFLTLRARAFVTDDYLESDLAWMDLDAPVEPTIGPYETYEDELFGYKAAFESYVTLRDEGETARLAALSKHLQEIEDNLPIPKEYRNPKIGAQAPIRVVQEIYAAGDAAKAVRSAAFNLPNDERVVARKGSKRVMLKNIQAAKFDKVLVPIASRVLAPKDRAGVRFDAFFMHILAHELCHGLGPHEIQVSGRATSPRAQLKDLYGGLEEAKADVLGLYALGYLLQHAKRLHLEGILPSDADAERRLYITYLASTFRTLRFGTQEAHAKGMAVQVNALLDKGAIRAAPDGTFGVDLAKFRLGVKELAHDLLMIEARGDRAGAQAMFERLGVTRPPIAAAIARLEDIPVDILPIETPTAAGP